MNMMKQKGTIKSEKMCAVQTREMHPWWPEINLIID